MKHEIAKNKAFHRQLESCLHMTRVGTIPVDLEIPDLNVERRKYDGIKI